MSAWPSTMGLAIALFFGLVNSTQAQLRVFVDPANLGNDFEYAYALPTDQATLSLPLFIDGGSLASGNTGQLCVDAPGDELCGYQIHLESTSSSLRILSFTPEPQSASAIVFQLTAGEPDQLSIIWADPSAPKFAGPQRVGSLIVSTSQSAGSLVISGGGAVLGNLSWTLLDPVSLAHIAVPEANFSMGLLLGSLFLLLMRLSAHRSIPRAANSIIPLTVLTLTALTLLRSGNAEAADPNTIVDGHWRMLAVGEDHTCGILESGRIACFGEDSFLQITNAPDPAYSRIDADGNVTCAVALDGTIDCWGGNPAEILSGVVSPPAPAAGLHFVDVSIRDSTGCAVLNDRSVLCWGDDFSALDAQPRPGLRATEVSVGVDHACARRPSATVECWGSDPANAEDFPTAYAIDPFVYVGAGESFGCALRPTGDIDCWGSTNNGRTHPPAGVLFKQLNVGLDHSCAVELDGSVACWGKDGVGETVPPGGKDFVAVYAGDSHSCGRRENGTAVCWGDLLAAKNDFPQSRITNVSVGGSHSCGFGFDLVPQCWGSPVLGQLMSPTISAQMLSAGTNHTCALTTAGTMSCWGANNFLQLAPPFIPSIQGPWLRVSAGGNVNCGIYDDQVPLVDGEPIICWGEESFGQLKVPAGRYLEVSVGAHHACAIDASNQAVCWGGLASVGETDPPSLPFSEIASGTTHTCGVTTEGDIRCWGANNFGQSERQNARFTSVAVGTSHSCGLLIDGRIRCWGNPTFGKTTPPPGRFESISAGVFISCGTRIGGGFVCWGRSASNKFPPMDSDSDGHEDSADNCPFISNGEQLDGDGDGVGDACDVCPALPDSEQLDYDGDGIGDRCDTPPRIILRPGSTPDSFDIQLDCGTSTLISIDPEIVIPFFDMGAGTPTAVLGAIPFNVCTPANCLAAAPFLGSTVDPLTSTAEFFGSAPGPGIRPGSLRMNLNGNPNLCNPGETVDLGSVSLVGATNLSVLPSASPPDVSTAQATNSNGFAVAPTYDTASVLAETYLELAFESEEHAYSVSLSSTVGIHRASFGIRMPPDATQLTIESWGDGVAQGSVIVLNPPHNPPLGSPPMREDTVYFQILGQYGANASLNVGGIPSWPIVTFSVNATGIIPAIIEFEGVPEAFVASPFEAADSSPIPLEDVGYILFGGGDDTDGDGPIDESDNCPYAVNPDQDDDGGLGTFVGDGVGNVCECGDATGEGSILSSNDPISLRDFLVENSSSTSGVGAVCSVTSGSECNALDLVVLDLALSESGTGIQAVCNAAIGTALLSQ